MTIPAVIYRPSPFWNARDSRYALRGIVNHRIVGTLESARAAFGVAPGTPRNASTHFGIGDVGGALTIDQFVRLDRMAWGNGDVRDPSWSRIIPGVNPNLYTVSIEHEDNGSAGRGIITERIWQASMELQRLLTSGDAGAIRAQGIQGATDSIVAQLAAIPKDATGFIDHNQIAGPNKPYCLRRWLDDPGFVYGAPSRRDRLLAYVNAKEDDDVLNDYLKGGGFLANRRAIFTSAEKWTGRSTPAFNPRNYDENALFAITGSNAPAIRWVEGTNVTLSDGTVYDARTRWLACLNSGGVFFVHERDVTRLEPIEAVPADPADIAAAAKAVKEAGIGALTAEAAKHGG